MIEYENLNKVNAHFSKTFLVETKKLLKSGQFILGKNVTDFEHNFAKYNKSNYCVSVANGLDALHLSLKICNFAKGSEIIVPSNTYIATIFSIINNGLKPVLVEPDINTYNINPFLIEEKITAKTKAIIVVHLYGKACNMNAISNICNKYNLLLIEDCAQAHGAKYFGQNVGTFGNYGAFSFYPTKNLGALGDAGCILTKTAIEAIALKTIRNYGSLIKYNNMTIGVNSRMDELQAVFLNIKLKQLNKINNHKRKLAKLYLKNLKSDFIKPVIEHGYHDVYHIFNIRHPKRDKLREYLLKNNIKTEIHYPIAPHNQQALQGFFKKQKFPISEKIHNTTVSLPISFFHSEKDIYKIIETINKF